MWRMATKKKMARVEYKYPITPIVTAAKTFQVEPKSAFRSVRLPRLCCKQAVVP